MSFTFTESFRNKPQSDVLTVFNEAGQVVRAISRQELLEKGHTFEDAVRAFKCAEHSSPVKSGGLSPAENAAFTLGLR